MARNRSLRLSISSRIGASCWILHGAVDVRRDAAALARLAAGHGSFVRSNGSWKDF